MSLLLHIADRVLNTPLLITPDKAQVILSVLAGRIGLENIDMSRFEGSNLEIDANGRAKIKPYRVTDKGTGIITVTGSLVNRGAWLGSNSGLTSYEGVQHQIKSAMNDSSVKNVLLDMHSPGGEAVGAFETAAMIRDLAATKKTVAVVNGLAASAGYLLASGANEIVTGESGVAGSIGIVMMHIDRSQQLRAEGISPTLIYAGKHKVDGNPLAPLSDEVRADLQAEVDNMYESFVKAVGKGRGSRLTAAAARKTEARTFVGKEAVDVGLADKVGSFQMVLADLSRGSGRSTSQTRRTSMSENEGAPVAENTGTLSQQLADAKRSGTQEGYSNGYEKGLTQGAVNERARLASIMGAEGIAGNAARLSAALELASDAPEMEAEKIIAFAVKNVPEALANGVDPSLANRVNLPDSLAAAGVPPVAAKASDGWKKAAEKQNARFDRQH